MIELHGTWLAAWHAALLDMDALPGTEVYIAHVTVEGHGRGYRVVPAHEWPDYAWQARVQGALAGGTGRRVECTVCLVVRKPVEAPAEHARHSFIIGRLAPVAH